jgi:hypothetical protein
MAFQRGAQAAQEEINASKSGGDFERVEFLSQILKKEGDQIVLRFVHDGHEWYFAKEHFEDTKAADPNWDDDAKKKWPLRMPAVCRHDKNIAADECFWCDVAHTITPNPKTKDFKRESMRGKYFPRVKYRIPAVVRKPIIVTQEMIDSGEVPAVKRIRGEERSMLDMIIGYEDEMIEVDEKDADGKSTGRKVMRPRVILCAQSHDNFVAGLQADWEASCDTGTGTILDRDFRCKRTGEGFDVKYPLSALPITPEHDLSDPTPVWCLQHDRRAEGAEGALVCSECAGDAEEAEATGEPFVMPKLVPLVTRYNFLDIESMITEQASEDYYARFFDPRVPRPGEEKRAAADEEEAPFASRPSDDEAEAAKEAIRQSMGKKSAAAQPVG